MKKSDIREGVYQITHCLSVGQFPDAARVDYLRRIGVTHLLNLASPVPAEHAVGKGFKEVACRPLVDWTLLPVPRVIECLDEAHRMLGEPGSKLYIHCIAGQNRSPNILWLYLIACGMSPEEARTVIEERSLDARPGHPMLVDEILVGAAREHGEKNFRPLKRGEILKPI